MFTTIVLFILFRRLSVVPVGWEVGFSLHDYIEMHGQQNIKLSVALICFLVFNRAYCTNLHLFELPTQH